MRKKYLSALLFGALLVTSTGTFTSCKDYDDDINNLQEQITANADAIKKLQEMIGDGKFVTNIVAENNGLKITWNDDSSTVIENVINGEAQKGDVVSIDPETGEIKINNEGTGFFASKGEDEEEIKLPYVNDEGVLVLVDAEGKEVVTGIRVAPVTAVVNPDGSAVITIVAADGSTQTVNVPSAASMIQDLEIMGWAIAEDPSEDLAKTGTDPYEINNENLLVNYAFVSQIYDVDKAKETTWSAQKDVVKGQVLTTLAATNTKLVTRVSPAKLDLSQLNFSLQDSKGNKLPIKLNTAEAFTGTLTRSASGISYIPMDVTSDIYSSVNDYTDLFTDGALYSLVEEKSGARSTYSEFTITSSPATVTEKNVNKVGGKVINSSSEYEVDVNKANKLEFEGDGIVYDYYVEAKDKAVADLFNVTIDKKNGTFTVGKLADEVSTATFQLNVYKLHLDGKIYTETITIKPTRRLISEVTLNAGDQIIKQAKTNGAVDAGSQNYMKFEISLDDMFASMSQAQKDKWTSATLGANVKPVITGIKINGENASLDGVSPDFSNYYYLKFYDANGDVLEDGETYKATKVVVYAKYLNNSKKRTLDVGKSYEVIVDFKNTSSSGDETLNTVKLAYSPVLPAINTVLVKHPSFWEGNKLMGYSEKGSTKPLSYDIVDGFKTYGNSDGDYTITLGLSDDKVNGSPFVNLTGTTVAYADNPGTNQDKYTHYNKEFTVNVTEVKYLKDYYYTPSELETQSFSMVILDPIYEGRIEVANGTSLEVFATNGFKLSMDKIVGYNYNNQTYALYKDDKFGTAGNANAFSNPFISNIEVISGDTKVFTVNKGGIPTVATKDKEGNVTPGYVTISTKAINNDTNTTIKVKVTDVWGYNKIVEIPLTIKMDK